MTNEEARARVDEIHALAKEGMLARADDKRYSLFIDTLRELRDNRWPLLISSSAKELVMIVLEVE